MIKEYESIIEDVLEAKDKGISLATLLEAHQEQKGEYSDAWKFVEGIDDYMSAGVYPDKERFFGLIKSLPDSKPIISHWMNYFAFATPALILLFVIFSYNKGSDTAIQTAPLISEQDISTTSLFESVTTEETSTQMQSDSAFMAKSSPILTEDTGALDSTIASLQSAYALDSTIESESSVSFKDTSDYNNLSSLYE